MKSDKKSQPTKVPVGRGRRQALSQKADTRKPLKQEEDSVSESLESDEIDTTSNIYNKLEGVKRA